MSERRTWCRTRMWLAAVIAVLMPLALAACGSDSGSGSTANSDADEPLVIGAPLALSGEFAFTDIPQRQGMEYAVAELNKKGGIDGHKVELQVRDMKSDPKLGGLVAQELLDDGAQVLVPVSWPEAAVGILDAGARADVASVFAILTTPIGADAARGTVALVAFSDPQQTTATAEYALEQGERTAVTVSSPDHPYTQNNPRYFEETFTNGGGKVIGDVEFTIGQTDFGSVARKIAGLDPDMVFTSMFVPDTPVFLKALRAAGYDGPVYGTDGFDSPALTKVAGKAAENVCFTIAGFPVPGSEFEKVVDGIEQGQGERPESTAFAALGYDSVQMIKAAVEKAGSVDPAAITEAFDDLGKVPGTVTGDMTVTGHNQFPTKPVTVVCVENGELTQVDQRFPKDVPAE